MWETTETKLSNATRQAVWALWTDVGRWNQWDPGVEYAELSGAFTAGTTGVLKSRNGPRSKFKIIEATENRSFTNRSRLPFCTLDFIHELAETPTGIAITHRVVIRGLLAPLFAGIVGKQQQKNLPEAVESLAELAGKR
jgi:carbon monoxide dehydrogenase subunit G